jgi:hypothetical protein
MTGRCQTERNLSSVLLPKISREVSQRQCHVEPCHNGMMRPRVAVGEHSFQIWMEATNILNKQSRTCDKG